MPAAFTDKNLTHWQSIVISAPKDYSGTAATTEWVNMGKAIRARIIIQTGAWAAGTAAVTLNEATSNTGTSSDALEFDWMHTNDGATGSPVKTKTAVASDTFNLDTAGSIYEIEIHRDEMSEDHNYLNIAVASPGGNSDFYSIIMLLELTMPGAAAKQENTAA